MELADIAIIIPARYASTRFFGKPMVPILGKTMIERTYKQALKATKYVVVATDDDRIYDEVIRFGGKVVMTKESHRNGTERCFEASGMLSELFGRKFSAVVNVQGDEPYINPESIKTVMQVISRPETEIATLVKRLKDSHHLKDPNTIKAVFANNKRALYFSRSPIPFIRDANEGEVVSDHRFFKHIGIYAYKLNILEQIVALPETSLEIAEKLEQNRWLQNGYGIFVEETEFESIAIDSEADLDELLKKLKNKDA